MLKKHVVVDGSNIATEARTSPSLTQLDEAVRAFLEEHPSEHATVIVDATFGHRIHESEQDAFEAAVDAGELLTAPAGTIGRGDAFILEVADKADATVLSNDSFQEFHGRYTWLFDEGRLVGGKPVPGVGWVFLLRSPVRGAVSRRAVKEARDQKPDRGARPTAGSTKKAGSKKASSKKAAAKKAGARATAKRRGKRGQAASADRVTSEAVARAAADDGSGARKRAREPLEPLNEPLPFIEFVAAHPVGSMVSGSVARFSSHGAYVEASGARCYVPLKLMGDPPPKSAKEILRAGETREFVVSAIDPPRRGIDLALANADLILNTNNNMPADQQEQHTSASLRARARPSRSDARVTRDDAVHARSQKGAKRASTPRTSKTHTKGSTLATNTRADQRAEEAPVTPARKRKAAAKRTAKKSAKRSPARRKKAAAKRPAKKRAAKRTAKKRATKKRAAKRSPARRKKAAAKRPAKKRATKKRATKKRATKKRATKKRAAKRPAKKRATKKRATKKRASKKRAAKRPAKKRATKRRARRRR
jgi:hypothetical protein